MANISEYATPVGKAIEPSDRAATTAREAGTVANIFAREEGQALGGAISRVGGQIGEQVDRHLTAQAIGHGAATYSSLYSGFTQQWNEVAAKSDPNDTSIASGFTEKILEPGIEKFLAAFDDAPQKAKDWAQTRAIEMRQHFFTKITADMGTRAAAAVHQNLGEMERNYSNAAANDPTTLSHITEAIKSDVDAQVAAHQIGAGDAARIKAELVPKMQQRVAQSAFDGMAQRDPNAAILALDHGDFNQYADAVTQAQWRKYAETQKKVQEHDAKQDALTEKFEAKQASSDKAEEYRLQMYDPNSGRVLKTQPKLNQTILQDPKILPADKTALIRWNETQYQAQLREDKQAEAGAPTRDNPKVLKDLRQRVGDPDRGTTRTEVSDALSSGDITVKSARDLAWRVGQSDAGWQQIQRPFQSQFANFQRTMLNSPFSLVKYMEPQAQLERFNQIEADAQKLLREAYARRDEHLREYLDPSSSKWVLREAAQSLTGPSAEAVQRRADAIRRNEEPSKADLIPR